MRLLKRILTANDCYKTKQAITPKGVMVHSTGENNTMLRRYVQPLSGDADYDDLITLLGKNPNGNSWNRSGTNACVHAFVGKLAVSAWTKPSWGKSVAKGITDGTEPRGTASLEAVITMLDRIWLIDN